VIKLLFTDNDTRLVSAAGDGTTRIWRIEQLPAIIAWAQTNRQYPQMTCIQRQLYNLPQTDCKAAVTN
jgi:WD40 repeat protein